MRLVTKISNQSLKMSQSNKYLSKYSNGKSVSAAQYITELICERKASKDKQDLHYRFWASPKWQAFYKNQIASAHKLLKSFPDKAIIRALLTDEGKKIYSLRAPHLPDIIKKEAALLEKENTVLTKSLERKTDVSFSKSSNLNTKNNIISKLKDLDYEP
jgi:hypothetical protein